MTCQTKAAHISLLLHGALVLALLLLGRYTIPETMPLVIDFSIAAAQATAGEPTPASGSEQRPLPGTSATEKKPVARNKEKPKKAEKKKNAPKRVRETKSSEVPATEGLRPVPVVKEPTTEPRPASANSETLDDPTGGAGPAQGTGGKGSQGEASAGAGSPAGFPAHTGQGNGGDGGSSDFEYIRRLIVSNLTFPAAARKMGLSGKIVVSFLLKENGQVEGLTLVSGSGHPILDDSVVATIRRLAPFPRPPVRAQLVVPIVFNLHEA